MYLLHLSMIQYDESYCIQFDYEYHNVLLIWTDLPSNPYSLYEYKSRSIFQCMEQSKTYNEVTGH